MATQSGNSQHTTGASDYQIVREYFRVSYGAPVTYKVPKANPSVRERIMLTTPNCERRAARSAYWWIPGARS